jgi:hypothetical protein
MSVSLTDEVAMTDKPADAAPPAATKMPAFIPGVDIQPQFVNRFHVLVNARDTRIIFGDAAVGVEQSFFHSSVVMSTENAAALAELLNKLIKQNQSTTVQKV